MPTAKVRAALTRTHTGLKEQSEWFERIVQPNMNIMPLFTPYYHIYIIKIISLFWWKFKSLFTRISKCLWISKYSFHINYGTYDACLLFGHKNWFDEVCIILLFSWLLWGCFVQITIYIKVTWHDVWKPMTFYDI